MASVHETTDTQETSRLISSEKVAGTSVENPRGDSLGSIEEIMIDKISGQVGYAVLKYGSFLGMGGKLFAVPWDILKYDTGRGAYIIDIPEDRLRGAPSFETGREVDMTDAAWNRRVHDYYGVERGLVSLSVDQLRRAVSWWILAAPLLRHSVGTTENRRHDGVMSPVPVRNKPRS